MAIRLATIRAIGINYINPSVTFEGMEWGRDLALWSAERMMADAGDFMAENDNQRDTLFVLGIIKQSPAISKNDLRKKLNYKFKAAALAAILADLIENGDVLIADGERAATGGVRPKLYYPVGAQ